MLPLAIATAFVSVCAGDRACPYASTVLTGRAERRKTYNTLDSYHALHTLNAAICSIAFTPNLLDMLPANLALDSVNEYSGALQLSSLNYNVGMLALSKEMP
ncbi:hypothetical protein PLICRDRAFT_432898 [Plicaturopsis crispa FD-325 SS-3]|uniref:Heme haloperoxidase family profile domain-containing protein n=1 Tax=Plicaturopsis crispa FD-325 SS-3 TaxID=944288 RepID=A0A0C9SWV0_PLICR|nr:hypothetical protein PLICRDRAFT_432898 [Plicaturopsis crispa FD-325 SS-3]